MVAVRVFAGLPREEEEEEGEVEIGMCYVEEEEEEEEKEKPKEKPRDVEEEAPIKPKVLTPTDILMLEILSNRRFLGVFLELGVKPRTVRELENAEAYDADGTRLRISRSSLSRYLKKLVNVGVAQAYGGIDLRKRYYKLTDTGVEVLERILSTIKKVLLNTLMKHTIGEYRGYRGALVEEYERFVTRRLGCSPNLLAELLKAKKVKDGYRTYIMVKYEGR